MTLDLQRDGFVVTVQGAAGAPFAALRDALDALTPGAATRAIVFDLTDDGAPDPAPTAEELRWLEQLPIPLVAALAGSCLRRALELACAADIRVGDATLTLDLASSSTARWTLLSRRWAERDAEPLRSAHMHAAEALEAGLISALVPPGEALAEAQRKAAVIASRGPIATRLAKEAIGRGLPQPLAQALRFETDLTLLLQTTKDRSEGVRAFLEKRTPHFTGT
jgi:enoyl-CoA hydratase/carnithine racemase